MKKEDEKYYWGVVASWCNWEHQVIAGIRERFGDIEKIWMAMSSELRQILKPKMQERFAKRENYPINKFREKLKRLNIEIIFIEDKHYPIMLREIADPPVVIYSKGDLGAEEINIGIVGPRRASGYGYRMVERIARVIAQAGVTVVSGLALGIDGAAHQACLRSGGKTVAVLANGLDIIYPESHRGLAKTILEKGGAIISEYPPGVEPLPHHFLARNRIVAGLSKGVVIIEAGERSGALVTARLALEYNRAVFGVPGDAERAQSVGVNRLIKQGATPVISGEEVLDELNIELPKLENRIRENAGTEIILDLLDKEPKHVDVLAREMGITVARLNGILMEMELEGIVKNVGGMRYVKE